MNNKVLCWTSIIVLLAIAIYCEFHLDNSIINDILDVALVFIVFYVGQRDADGKNAALQEQNNSQQAQLQKLQERIEKLERAKANLNNQSNPQPASNDLWEYAVKR